MDSIAVLLHVVDLTVEFETCHPSILLLIIIIIILIIMTAPSSGMVFHAGVALKAGIKYQVVMLTQMHRTFYTNHEWQNLEGAVPSPAIQPEEALGEGSDLGDVGERPSVEACREVCAQLIL